MMHKNRILERSIYSMVAVLLATVGDASAANVVQRPSANANRVSVSRPTQAASRMPTMTVKTGSTSTSVSTTSTNTETTAQTETKPEPVIETPTVENKSSQFGSGLASKSATETDTAAATLAEMVRAQRAALDAAGAMAVVSAPAHDVSGTGENNCDTALRECMIQKCGSNFGNCIADTDTTFFDKMDTCRRSTKCTGHEYQLFSAEIKADRDFNAKLAAYNATIDCGNSYDTCIVGQCGATYSKCIGKSAGDNAIAKCESIAKSCVEYDSGLAMRAMGVFGELRQTAERQIATDEQKLYALREQMRSVCTRLGAMFDERSLDCVYTVNFYAGNDNTLFASKKLYAGSVFDCTQNWFGIDVTTFRENAFRETRAQTSASSAMLGSGLGQAVGAFTSGAFERASKRYKADNALNDALEECMKKYTESECRAKIGTTTKEKTGKDSGNGAQNIQEEIKKLGKQVPTNILNKGTGAAAAAVARAGSATQTSGHSAQGSASSEPQARPEYDTLGPTIQTKTLQNSYDVLDCKKLQEDTIPYIQEKYNVTLNQLESFGVQSFFNACLRIDENAKCLVNGPEDNGYEYIIYHCGFSDAKNCSDDNIAHMNKLIGCDNWLSLATIVNYCQDKQTVFFSTSNLTSNDVKKLSEKEYDDLMCLQEE